MAYVGNKHGPRESLIVMRLGSDYFGISPAQLDEEIGWYEEEERREEVTPVRKDSRGRYFIIFLAPGGGTQQFYLDEHGYVISGKVRIWGDSEPMVEVRRDE